MKSNSAKIIRMDTVKTSRKLRKEGDMPVEQADAISDAVHSAVADAASSVNDNVDNLRQELNDGLKAVRDENRREHKELAEGVNSRFDKSDKATNDRFDKSDKERKEDLKAVYEKIDKSNDRMMGLLKWAVGLMVGGLTGMLAAVVSLLVVLL